MADEKKKDEDEKIVMVSDHGELDDSGKPKEKAADKEEVESKEDDEAEESEEEEGSEERVGHSSTEEDERRESRRKERQATKVRRREARDRNQRELTFLRQRNEQLERRFSQVESRTGQNEVLAVDQRISQIKASLKTAEEVMADAVEQAKGKDFSEARRIHDQLRDDLNQLTQVKSQIEAQAKEPRTQEPDPALRALADEWREEHSWWKPGGSDDDSKVVSAIDAQLTREGGYDPTTQDYWDELSRRVQKRLPHRYKKAAKAVELDDEEMDDEEEEEAPRRSSKGPKFSAGGRERPLKKNQVYVSPERIAALKDLGAWDDPILRKRYLKRYQDYDREHATRN